MSRRVLTSVLPIGLSAMAATVFVTGCGSGCAKSRAETREPSALDVGFAGCAAVVRAQSGERVCELGPSRSLRFVPRASDITDFVVRAGDTSSTREIVVPVTADRVVCEGVVGKERRRFVLLVRDSPRFGWLDDAKARRGRGDLDGAHAIGLEYSNDDDPLARAFSTGLLARIALARGRADEAFPLFRSAIAQERSLGRISDAMDDTFALAFALHQRSQRYDEARGVLASIELDRDFYPEGRAREPYYRGILAAETGDHRTALGELRRAEAEAHRLGMRRLERNARTALALEMQDLGRAEASLEVLRTLVREIDEAQRDPVASESGDAPTPCEKVAANNNLGWGAFLVDQARGAVVVDAKKPLDDAIAVTACSDAYLRSFALANRARLLLFEGDIAGAERDLEASRAAVREPRGSERVAALELEGRILLAKQLPERALRKLDEARTVARSFVLSLAEWSALSSRGEALDMLGRWDEAIAAYLAAEEILDDAVSTIPLGEGRGGFIADRSRSMRGAIDVLVRRGRIREAAGVAKHARARVLASVERALRIEALPPGDRVRWEEAVRSYRAARASIDESAANDWKLPADALAKVSASRAERERELRSALERAIALVSSGTSHASARDYVVAEGEIDLVIAASRKGWLALTIDAHDASSASLPPPSSQPAEIARALFEPIAARIDKAKIVHVRASGPYRSIDVHALPFRRLPLLETVAVDYPIGFDRLDAAGSTPAAAGTRDALVVGDPTGDLPSAAEEAKTVARALGANGTNGSVRMLLRDAATSRAVNDALRGAALLHYAGHGVFAGPEGWESALPLADGGRLSIADVLAASPAPKRVVLSGCDTARSEGEVEGLGLAQAFVIAGASEVLAPVRPVSDELAARLASGIYTTTTVGDLAALTRAVASRLRAGDPSIDWSAFRVLSP